MARLSVGPTWRSLTPEQKRRAIEAYSRYIAAIYATRFDDYAGEKLEVLGQQQIRHGTLIKTRIVKSNGEPVAINYVVHDNDHAWQIRDIYLSGSISELATRRSDFANILRTSGIDGLIASLNKRPTSCKGDPKSSYHPGRRAILPRSQPGGIDGGTAAQTFRVGS